MLQGKEKSAIDFLYRKVMPKVKSYVLKNSGDEDSAKDAFHDALVKMVTMAKQGKLKDTKDLPGYVFVMAKNFWVEKSRRDKKVVYSNDLREETQWDTPADQLHERQKEKEMERVLNLLGERCKELLKLTFFLDYSLKEAAEKLDISSDEVAKTTQYRCKKKLFGLVKDDKNFRTLMGYE